MSSSASRYFLRFTAGAREGERIALEGAVTSVGRRADNAIAITHSSVSGRHAELVVDDTGVKLVDRGSTNGTRVDGEKVEERRLAHGDVVVFGQVKAVFEDGELTGDAQPDVVVVEGFEDDAPVIEGDDRAPAPSAAEPAGGGESLMSVSADRLAAARSRSKLLPFLLVALVALGGLAAWRFLGERREAKVGFAIAEVPGNLLANGHFEDTDAVGWTSADAAPQSFFTGAPFAASGEVGLGAFLEPSEWAFSRSASFDLPFGKLVRLEASLAASGGVTGRVGLELVAPSGELPDTIAWAPGISDTRESIELLVPVLPGYERGAVVVAARAEEAGDAAVDDVAVTLAPEEPQPAVSFEEYDVFLAGSNASIVRSGRVVLPDLELSRWSAAGLSGWASSSWTARATSTGFELEASASAPQGAVLAMTGARIFEDARGAGRIATMGGDGYRSHTATFEREGVTDLLGGEGVNLIRFGWDEPVSLSCRLEPERVSVRADFAGQGRLEVQLTFKDERAQAEQLARDAREAEREERYGASIATWTELLDGYAFAEALVDEAEAARGRLTSLGHDRIEEVRREFEHARFFSLMGLFSEASAHAREVAEGFEGSPTADEALALAAEIDQTARDLALDHRGERDGLLRAVLSALDKDAEALREHVSTAMKERGE